MPRRSRTRRSPRERAGAGSTPRPPPEPAFLLPRLPGLPPAPPPGICALIARFQGTVKGAPGRVRSPDGRAASGGEVFSHEPRAASQRVLEVAEEDLPYPLPVNPRVE